MSELGLDGALFASLLGLLPELLLLLLLLEFPGPAAPDESMSSIAAKGSTSAPTKEGSVVSPAAIVDTSLNADLREILVVSSSVVEANKVASLRCCKKGRRDGDSSVHASTLFHREKRQTRTTLRIILSNIMVCVFWESLSNAML